MRALSLTLPLPLSLALALALALAGCGLLPPSHAGRSPTDDLSILRAGMSARDLRYRIGSPADVTEEPDGSERWTYVYDADVAGGTALVVDVRDGTVRRWEERPAE